MKASLDDAPHPLQPLLRHTEGGRKFHPNAIVVALLNDHGAPPLSLLQDAAYSLEDRAHFAQLLGAFEQELSDWGLIEALPPKRRARPALTKPPLHPVQPLVLDSKQVIRFKKNPLVRFLLDDATRRKTLDLNRIAMMDFPADDFNQLAQLIGYSHSGAPSYVPTRAWNAADREWTERKRRVAMQDVEERVERLDQGLPAAVQEAESKSRF